MLIQKYTPNVFTEMSPPHFIFQSNTKSKRKWRKEERVAPVSKVAEDVPETFLQGHDKIRDYHFSVKWKIVLKFPALSANESFTENFYKYLEYFVWYKGEPTFVSLSILIRSPIRLALCQTPLKHIEWCS